MSRALTQAVRVSFCVSVVWRGRHVRRTCVWRCATRTTRTPSSPSYRSPHSKTTQNHPHNKYQRHYRELGIIVYRRVANACLTVSWCFSLCVAAVGQRVCRGGRAFVPPVPQQDHGRLHPQHLLPRGTPTRPTHRKQKNAAPPTENITTPQTRQSARALHTDDNRMSPHGSIPMPVVVSVPL